MAKSDPVEQLSTLNELLARAGVSSPECAEHARKAIAFYREQSLGGHEAIPLKEAANRLVQLHFEDAEEAAAFAHWHMPPMEAFDPLWIRQELIAEMKTLAGRNRALFLVTGLRESVCPKGKYWTRKRQQDYSQMLEWLQTMLCAWASRGTQLQLVIL